VRKRRNYVTAGKVKLTVATPSYTVIRNKEVDMVTYPGEFGVNGVLASHAPQFGPLKPGVLYVSTGNEVEKYFVSSGYAFVHPDCTVSINAVECVTLDSLDIEAARSQLKFYEELEKSSTDEKAKFVAKASIECASAIIVALSSN